MLSFIKEFLAVSLPPLAGAAIVMFLAKNWFLERLRASINNEYNMKLVQLEADLSAKSEKEIEGIKALINRDASIMTAVQKAFADSHSSSQPLRIEAVKGLWDSLLHVQRNSPVVFSFLDVLLPSEYGEVLGEKQLKTFSEITNEDIEKLFCGNPMYAQNHRLISGDYLWPLFYAY